MSGWERRPCVPNLVPCQHKEGDGAQGLTLGTGASLIHEDKASWRDLWLCRQGHPPRGWGGVTWATQQEAWGDSFRTPHPQAQPCWVVLSHPLTGAPRGFLLRPRHILMTNHSATKHLFIVQRRGQGREVGLDLASPSFPLTHNRQLRPSHLPDRARSSSFLIRAGRAKSPWREKSLPLCWHPRSRPRQK